MSDVFSVTAAWNKTSYNTGDTMTGSITGTNAHTTGGTTVTETGGPVEIPVVSESGAASVVELPVVNVVRTVAGTTTTEAVVIDTAAFTALQGGRTWVVSADKKSISAVA